MAHSSSFAADRGVGKRIAVGHLIVVSARFAMKEFVPLSASQPRVTAIRRALPRRTALKQKACLISPENMDNRRAVPRTSAKVACGKRGLPDRRDGGRQFDAVAEFRKVILGQVLWRRDLARGMERPRLGGAFRIAKPIWLRPRLFESINTISTKVYFEYEGGM